MNWVVVGMGNAGQAHARTIMATKGLTLRGIYDTTPEVLKKRAQEFGVRPYESFRSILRDPEIHGATIATPSATHAQLAVALLAAGKHVLVEKPFALDATEAHTIAKVSEETKRLALPFHNRRWDPDFRLVLDVVRSGMLGQVKVVRSTVCGSARETGWRLLRRFGGGRLNDWGPHLFSQVYEWFGDRPRSLTGYTLRVYPDNLCDDLFAADFIFPGNVRVSVMMSGFCYIPSPRWEVLGTEGTLQVTGNIHDEFTLHCKRADGQEFLRTYRRQEVAPPVPIYSAIVQHCTSGVELPVSLHEGIVVSEWLERVRSYARQYE